MIYLLLQTGDRYPVMFWIHGGVFVLGSALNRVYEGDALSAFNDVVVVSTNYRLNGYGFLSTGMYNNGSGTNYQG